MAHLITVTDSNNQELLFNLDTAISFEKGQHGQTIVTTRWGRTDIRESLEEIMEKYKQTSDPTWITQKNV
jgi:hypothetical protein|tara:strand:+ start:129 stop:338 length:210 start_codon:yes stop_codon:yes gene_type:complete